jgi:TonB family protein
MATMTLISALLAIAPATASAPPAASEPDVWALVARVNSAPAYEVYLDRFPKGPHREAAVEAYSRLQGRPVLHAPPPPTPPVPPPIVTVVPPPPDACDILLFRPALNEGDAKEARAFNDARRSNRPADFQAYLSSFPSGACRERATRILTARKTNGLRFKRVPGLGPLAPHRLNPTIFSDEDYPASALRSGETGNVAAEWDVAEDGVVESCRVVRSSGSAILDSTTCRLITTRLRYDPARDAAGAVTRSVDRMSIGWTFPAG